MAQPYVGEIRIFAGNFAPAGWMFCEVSCCLSRRTRRCFSSLERRTEVMARAHLPFRT
jgi:microcystin-dependent protein